MALVMTESFDYGINVPDNLLNSKHGRFQAGTTAYQGGSTGFSSVAPGARHGRGLVYGPQSSSTNQIITILDPAQEDDCLICGVAVLTNTGTWVQYTQLLSFGENRIVATVANRTYHVVVESTATPNQWAVKNGTGAGASTYGTFTILPNAWTYLAIKVRCGTSNGEIEVRLIDNLGVETIPLLLTGLNTRSAGTGTTGLFNTVVTGRWTAQSTFGFSITIDDWYLLNEQGPAPNNNFLGDVFVGALPPGGVGSATQWALTNSSSNWQAVADAFNTAPDTSSYVSSSTVDQRDLYTLIDLSVTPPYGVASVAIYANASKTDTGSRSLATLCKLGANEVQSADVPQSSSLSLYTRQMLDTKPGGGAWTIADVNNLEIGIVCRP